MITSKTNSMKNQIFGFLRLMIFVLCGVWEVVNGEEEIRCIPEEREALLQFKAAIVDDYGMLSSWTTPDCCQWEGIRCNNLTNHISILDLHGEYPDDSGRYMSGEIHKSLMELPQLQYLNLSSNYFRDSNIPEFLGSLRNLGYLDLSSCGFDGKIPTQFGSLSHLKYLNLGWNYLEGSIPHQLGNLFHLQHLDLTDNNFGGNIPPQLGNLCQLQHLDLSENYFKGSIPPQLGNLSQLQHLDLSGNLFEGNIPPQLENLSQLQHLDISDNLLEGNITPQLGNLFRLQHLDLSENFFERIPPQLGNLSQLQELYLRGYNALNLTHGGHWLSNLLSLTHLYLGSVSNFHPYNLLQVIAKLPELRELSIVYCSLSDDFILSSMPSKFNFSTSLSVLDLSHNTFKSAMVFQWVSNFTSSLVELDLSDNHLEGCTSSNFGIVMNSLRLLDLSSNHFKASDFKYFSNICTLHSLYLYENKLTEGLPSILSNLSGGCVRHSLQELDLSSNDITGTLFDISVFSSLKSLFLYGNRLSGRIPEGVKLPSTLEDLSIGGNFFKGGIPKSFGNACALHSLHMSDNSFSVELPTIISHLSGCARYSLKRLYLDNNKLNGEIPKDFQFPPKLEGLYIYSNSLKGVLTDYHFANMSKLKDLDLSHNSLGLAFTQNWVPPFQLLTINLGSCNLGPTFPQWLQTQNKFIDIDISNASISDITPEWFWAKLPLHKVMTMDISHNNLQGTIPNVSLTYVSIFMDLGSNQFEGSIPLFLRNSETLDLSKNKFSNPHSFLCGDGAISVQFHLDISFNHLYGDIPDCWRQLNSLFYLDLSHNNFSGKIPTSMGLLVDVRALFLRNNNLVEEIPFSLRNCTSLVILDLSENNLSGSIPSWIGTTEKLKFLSLRNNQFFGTLPFKLCSLRNIHILDLSLNNLFGKIPKCIKYLTSMVVTRSSDVVCDRSSHCMSNNFNAWLTWKGSKQIFMNEGLSLLKSIDLSSNHFSEEIPREIEILSGLISLNLSRNNLIGKIPSNIGNLTSLETLDLSRNQFVGSIPSSLAQNYVLSMLDLSHNRLTGEIPTSTQLQSFNTSSYEDNIGLCGPPLEKLCIEGGSTQEPNVEVHEDEYSLLNNDLFVGMAFGFVVSFWMVFGSILFKRSCRHAYFNFLFNLEDYVRVKITIFAKVLKLEKD